jgi:hypothetical protein
VHDGILLKIFRRGGKVAERRSGERRFRKRTRSYKNYTQLSAKKQPESLIISTAEPVSAFHPKRRREKVCRMLISFFGAEQDSERGRDVKKPSRPKNSAWDGEENGKREKIAFPSFLQERIMRFARETQALRRNGKEI